MAELARVEFEYTLRETIAAAMHSYDLSPLIHAQVRQARVGSSSPAWHCAATVGVARP